MPLTGFYEKPGFDTYAITDMPERGGVVIVANNNSTHFLVFRSYFTHPDPAPAEIDWVTCAAFEYRDERGADKAYRLAMKTMVEIAFSELDADDAPNT